MRKTVLLKVRLLPLLYSRLRSTDLSICTHWYCLLDDWERFLASCFIVLIYET